MIVSQGLGDKNVERGARDFAALQAGNKSVLIDERAAGSIDNEQSGFRARQEASPSEAPAECGHDRGVRAVWRRLLGLHHRLLRIRAVPETGRTGGMKMRAAVLEEFGRPLEVQELDLAEPVLPWHTRRLPLAELGAELAVAAGFCAKIALDLELLAQTEVAEVTLPGNGRSTANFRRPSSRPVFARRSAKLVAIRGSVRSSDSAVFTAFTSRFGSVRSVIGWWHAWQ